MGLSLIGGEEGTTRLPARPGLGNAPRSKIADWLCWPAVYAILPTLGMYEMMLLLVIGLLLYGRNLPQAGRTRDRFVAQLQRGFQYFKDQMDRDESLREVRKTFEDTTREMRNITAVPRAIANLVNELRTLAR